MLRTVSLQLCKFFIVVSMIHFCKCYPTSNISLICSMSNSVQSNSVCRDEFDFGTEFSKRDIQLQLNTYCSNDESQWCVLMQFDDIDVDNGKCKANGRKESCDNLQVCEKLMSGLEANQNCFDIQNVTYTKSDRVQITSMHIFCCRNDHYCNDDEQSFFGDWLNCTQINELTWPPVVEEVGTDATDTAAYKVVSKCATNTIAILYILLMLSVAKLL